MRDLLSEVSHSTERMQSYLYFSYIFNNNKKISISLTLINSIRRYKSSTLPADATFSCMGMISWYPSSQAVSGSFCPLLRCGLGLALSPCGPCCDVVSGCHYRLPSPAALLSRAGIITFRPLLRCGLGLALLPCVPCYVVVSGCLYRFPSLAAMWSQAAIIALRPTSWSVCQRWSSRV